MRKKSPNHIQNEIALTENCRGEEKETGRN
jgi:hypothetical protein